MKNWLERFQRVGLVGVAILAQLAVLLIIILRFQRYFIYFYWISIAISVLAVLYLVNDSKTNPSYKIAWMLPILIFPIFGGLFYLMFGGNRSSAKEKKRMRRIDQKTMNVFMDEDTTLNELEQQDACAGNQSRYIADHAFCPPYRNTAVTYFPLGDVFFPKLLEELEKAEHFIFLEYFIIEPGKMWNPILEILKRKAAQGVDVRVIYDDFGSIVLLPGNYDKQLEAMGIKCCVFNRFRPVLSIRMNNRDHRKICVIDGNVGFTGGINLADEYINAKVVHGHWKDTAVMVRGDAVWSLTVMFLTMWDYLRNEDENMDYSRFKPQPAGAVESDGFVQPFTDSPLDDETIGENVYLNLLGRAKRYVYITTPYLIIDNEMITALVLAAKSGVDVRIITPHIADKWYVHTVTRAHYGALIESGVKIYEYTPGFIHAKSYVSDDDYGVVGTINMDFRSLYLHFECGVWMCGCSAVGKLKEDFLQTLEQCQQITPEQYGKQNMLMRLVRSILRVFAPLM